MEELYDWELELYTNDDIASIYDEDDNEDLQPEESAYYFTRDTYNRLPVGEDMSLTNYIMSLKIEEVEVSEVENTNGVENTSTVNPDTLQEETDQKTEIPPRSQEEIASEEESPF